MTKGSEKFGWFAKLGSLPHPIRSQWPAPILGGLPTNEIIIFSYIGRVGRERARLLLIAGRKEVVYVVEGGGGGADAKRRKIRDLMSLNKNLTHCIVILRLGTRERNSFRLWGCTLSSWFFACLFGGLFSGIIPKLWPNLGEDFKSKLRIFFFFFMETKLTRFETIKCSMFEPKC